MISARKAKQLDATTMFTYSHANTPLGQSERAYYLSYFSYNGLAFCHLISDAYTWNNFLILVLGTVLRKRFLCDLLCIWGNFLGIFLAIFLTFQTQRRASLLYRAHLILLFTQTRYENVSYDLQ